MVCRDTSTHFCLKPFRFTIAYVDREIAGKRVHKNSNTLFGLNRHVGAESIFRIGPSTVDTTSFSRVNPAVAGLPDAIRKSHRYGAPKRSVLEMVVGTPIILHQSSISILVLDA